MARSVGIEAMGFRDGHRETLGAHQIGHRIEWAGSLRGIRDKGAAGPGHLLGEAVREGAEHPDRPAGPGDADGAVTVFHGRVGAPSASRCARSRPSAVVAKRVCTTDSSSANSKPTTESAVCATGAAGTAVSVVVATVPRSRPSRSSTSVVVPERVMATIRS